MSGPRAFEKPSGVKDYLPETVAKLRHIELKALECMQSWGYHQIITPTLEYYDTVGTASSTSNKKLFKLLDKRGTTLVMRSDMTAPIARVTASLLKDEPLPIRLSYHSNVFRAIEEEAGRESEFYQTGVELVGDPTPEADAEVIALAVASLRAAGIESFAIALGHVGFLNGWFEEALKGRPDDQTALKQCLLLRDHVGYRRLVRQLALPERDQRQLEMILRLRGGEEVCEQAGQMTKNHAAGESIRHLCEVCDALKAYGVSQYISIDLTLIGNFSYYTGMTFEGYAEDLGFPVCNGGRYDNLLAQFGRPAPATGFALETDRILELAASTRDEAPCRMLVLYTAAHRAEAIRTAMELRKNGGCSVETRMVSDAARSGGIRLHNKDYYEYEGRTYQDVIQFVD